MDNLLRKYQWAVRLAGIAIAMTLVAIIVNHVIASRLAPLTVPKLPDYSTADRKAKTARKTPKNRPEGWDSALSSRCLFGCADQPDEPKTCPDGCPDGQECQDGTCVPTQENAGQQDSDVPVESDLNVKLMGCMVADKSEYSLAMIQDGSSQETYVVSTGDFLPGEARVVRIERDRIFINRNGRMEFIRLEKTIGGDPSPVSISSVSGSPQANQKVGDALGKVNRLQKMRRADSNNNSGDDQTNSGDPKFVREQQGDEFTLQRDSVREQLENPEEVAQEVRMVQNYKDGKEEGLRMVGVSPGGMFSELGFETGDVLRSVNGNEINDPTQARKLFEQFKESDSVEVVIERNGETVERQYTME